LKSPLHHINLEFPEKSVTALVGPSGSGKSTITRLIARFWDTDSGDVLFRGVPVKEMSSEKLLENISMVFQDVYVLHKAFVGGGYYCNSFYNFSGNLPWTDNYEQTSYKGRYRMI